MSEESDINKLMQKQQACEGFQIQELNNAQYSVSKDSTAEIVAAFCATTKQTGFLFYLKALSILKRLILVQCRIPDSSGLKQSISLYL